MHLRIPLNQLTVEPGAHTRLNGLLFDRDQHAEPLSMTIYIRAYEDVGGEIEDPHSTVFYVTTEEALKCAD